MSKLKFIDLFAGIGGMRLGFEQAGFHCVKSVEIDKKACETYKSNFGDDPSGDITKINPHDLPDFDVLVAGFPCQAFSGLGKRKGFADVRGKLFFNLHEILKIKSPPAFLLENVSRIKSHDEGKTLKTIIEHLEDLGYAGRGRFLNARHFGLPQNRERVFIAGFLSREACDRYRARKITKLTFQKLKLKDILESNVDESFYVSEKRMQGLERHKARNKAAGRGFGYQILDRNGLSHAVTCSGNGQENNLVQDENGRLRFLTPREFARLQGFPDDFKIYPAKTVAYKQFGNSVAVELVRTIAVHLRVALVPDEYSIGAW